MVGRSESIKYRIKKKLVISVTCIDERIAPRPQYLSFRIPGSNINPRGNEPSFTLAAILFLIEVLKTNYSIQLIVADHGILRKDGYTGCGMLGVEEEMSNLKEMLLKQSDLPQGQIEIYLNNLALYDLNNKGGIGQHAAWEVKQLEKFQDEFNFETHLAKILPNDLEKEQISNKRLVITQPYISQEGLLANKDEDGELYDGNTIIQTIAGFPDIHLDNNLINGLLISSYEKGFSVNEILVLGSIIDLFDQSLTRNLIQKIQQMMNFELKQISEKIADIVNLSKEQSYDYLITIKERANLCLYGLEGDRINLMKKFAEKIKGLGLLPKKIAIKYGLVDISGKIKLETIKQV